jgi:hypothetical protein
LLPGLASGPNGVCQQMLPLSAALPLQQATRVFSDFFERP